MLPLCKISFSLVFILFSLPGHARLIQIIHTNDLHSYFIGPHNGKGGYARLATKIKELKHESLKKGIPVLQLDGGDWGEGTSFFQVNRGVESIRALALLGAEAAVIGNHDFQLGGHVLEEQLRAANVETQFLSANMQPTPEMNLKGLVHPYLDLERAGVKIRIIGLTTSDDYFEYAFAPGKILSPYSIGEEQGQKAKKDGRELVIALTHIGLGEDAYLAANTSDIDLIVGGHSHTDLSAPKMVKNKKGKIVPIVQAHAHGMAVGSLLLDVKDNGEGIEVVDYRLHEITPELPADSAMESFVKRASLKRDELFDNKWDTIIGESLVNLTGYINGHPVYRSSCWGYHFATAARKAVKAGVGIHISNFEGVFKSAGPVTFGDVVDSFPHFRKFGDPGWEIVTVRMAGWKLRPLLYLIQRQGYGVTFSGLGYKSGSTDMDGVEDKANYTVAFPAEVALAIKTSLPQYARYLKGLKHTGKYYWPVMIQYVKDKSPLSCD